MKTHETRNGLAPQARHVSATVLNAALADSIALALLTKQAHWNVRGPNFAALHAMFDQFRTELDVHIDAIAERVAQLGAVARGTLEAVTQATRLPAYPLDIAHEQAHLVAMLQRYALVADAVRSAIDQTTSAGDANTADLLTGYSRTLDKFVWFLEAHAPPASATAGVHTLPRIAVALQA